MTTILWTQAVDCNGFGIVPSQVEGGYSYALFFPDGNPVWSPEEEHRIHNTLESTIEAGKLEAEILNQDEIADALYASGEISSQEYDRRNKETLSKWDEFTGFKPSLV